MSMAQRYAGYLEREANSAATPVKAEAMRQAAKKLLELERENERLRESYNERLGAAVQRAAAELPEGYELHIELERNAGTAALYIPPVSDEEGGRRETDFCGDGLAEHIENAIDMAVEHYEETQNAEVTGAAPEKGNKKCA